MVIAAKEELIPEAYREIVAGRPLTADDLNEFPDDDKRYEIIGGQLIVSPSPSSRHQEILTLLTTWVTLHVLQNNLGRVFVAPMDVHLSFYDVVQPDLLVVLDERRDIIQEKGIVGAPNLVVEILSPSSLITDRVDKAALYAKNGVQEYWIVDPIAETVTVYGLDGDRFSPSAKLDRDKDLYSPAITGLILDLDDIFPDMQPAPSGESNAQSGNE